MKIFITGDTHGDFSRLERGWFPELDNLSKEDYVLICGDFGGVWDDGKEEKEILDWLEQRPFTTLFVTGNHENYDLLSTLPVSVWKGGKVQQVRPSILHLMRGQVFELGDYTFFTMGGASSHDVCDGILEPDDPLFLQKSRVLYRNGALFRVNHQSWWKEELPSDAEYQEARANLQKHAWQVDYIVTHCAPTSIQNELFSEGYVPDALTDFLEEVRQKCRFRNWFFGHYHKNAAIEKKYVLLYEEMIEI